MSARDFASKAIEGGAETQFRVPRCYVCGDPEIVEAGSIGSATCELHVAARKHVISMQNEGAFCQCGWQTDLGRRQYRARERACKLHWLQVCEAVA